MGETGLQRRVVTALRRLGIFVAEINRTRAVARGSYTTKGTPDLLLINQGAAIPAELKDPAGRNRVDEDQLAWHEEAAARGLTVPIWRSVDEAVTGAAAIFDYHTCPCCRQPLPVRRRS